MRSYSPKYSSRPPECRKAAGELFYSFVPSALLTHVDDSIVEFASQEDSQRAIRELSEMPLLGRPVFIREVGSTFAEFTSIDTDNLSGPRK